jgi:hypothetical protein
MKMTYRLLPTVAAILASVAVWGDTPGTFQQEVAADPKGTVEISNTNGKIDVTGWDKAAVGVRAELGGQVDHVEVRTSGSHTTVQVVLRHGSSFNWGLGRNDTRLHVQVPKDSEIDVSGVSADLVTTGVLGSQRLKSVSGDISAESSGDEFEAKTVSGNLKVRSHGQPARQRLQSVSGDIELKHAAGELDASAVSGQISAELDPARSFHARTTSGDISFEGRLTHGADLDAQSVNGDLKVRAPSENGFRYELETLSGDISDCFDVKAERSSEYGPGHKLDGLRGAGDGHVRMKTMSGDLKLCDR